MMNLWDCECENYEDTNRNHHFVIFLINFHVSFIFQKTYFIVWPLTFEFGQFAKTLWKMHVNITCDHSKQNPSCCHNLLALKRWFSKVNKLFHQESNELFYRIPLGDKDMLRQYLRITFTRWSLSCKGFWELHEIKRSNYMNPPLFISNLGELLEAI